MTGTLSARSAVPLPAGALEPIEAVSWPGGDVAKGAGGYLVSHRADSAFAGVNQLLAAAKKVYWLKAGVAGVPGSAPGDFFIPAGAASPEELSKLSREAREKAQSTDK